MDERKEGCDLLALKSRTKGMIPRGQRNQSMPLRRWRKWWLEEATEVSSDPPMTPEAAKLSMRTEMRWVTSGSGPRMSPWYNRGFWSIRGRSFGPTCLSDPWSMFPSLVTKTSTPSFVCTFLKKKLPCMSMKETSLIKTQRIKTKQNEFVGGWIETTDWNIWCLIQKCPFKKFQKTVSLFINYSSTIYQLFINYSSNILIVPGCLWTETFLKRMETFEGRKGMKETKRSVQLGLK